MNHLSRVKVEHMDNPIGIDSQYVGVTWNIKDKTNQIAFQVFAKGHYGTSWDSGIVRDRRMSCRIEQLFQSREMVHVQIWSWEKEEEVGNQHTVSGEAYYEIGLGEKDWCASWINPEIYIPDDTKERPGSYLKNTFFVSESELNKKARIYVTSHGIYNIWINGIHIDGFEMAPGTTQYDKIMPYQTFDVGSYLKAGMNQILVTLGNGWWRGRISFDGLKNQFGNDVALLLQLELDEKCVLKSDDSWRATQHGPLRDTDNMDGEIYDARLEENLSNNAVDWHEVQMESFPLSNIHNMKCPAPICQEQFIPIILTTPAGEQVLDFGQNIAGVIEFKFIAESGSTYVFTHGETLDINGNFTTRNFQSGRYCCLQRIIYITREGENSYRPRNTFMGFRYVKVEGMKDVNPEDFRAYAIYTDLEITAKFHCGNSLVNQLFQNAMWSLKGNLLDIPTDCPTREKSGFSGDLQAYTFTFLYMMDAYPILQKFIRDQASSQYEDGCVKQIAADPRPRSLWDGGAGWCDSFEIIPNLVDTRYQENLFSEYYTEIKKWVDFLLKRAQEKTRLCHKCNPYHKYLVDTGIHWGEWLEPGSKTWKQWMKMQMFGETEVATAYLSYACRIFSEEAGRRGKEADYVFYKEKGQLASKAYHFGFVKRGKIKSKRMCRYIRPIVLGILSKTECKDAAKQLNQLVIQNKYHLNTGFLTTHELCRTLSDYGYVDTAYRLLLNEEKPGWLYSVKKGATSILENWEGFQEDGEIKDSFNHYSYGAIAGWLMDSAAGIRVENGRITIAPKTSKELKELKAEYLSPLGQIVSEWKYEGSCINYTFDIPGNTEAFIMLEDGTEKVIGPGRTNLSIVR